MPRTRQRDNPSTVARGGGWRLALAIIAVVAFVATLSAGLWAAGVFTSDIHGKGEQQKQINAPENRTFAQEQFVKLLTIVKADDAKLTQAQADVTGHPGDQFYQTNLTGLMNSCQDAIAQYDAAAQGISTARFRDAGLPAQIDTSDPATDCKPPTQN